jgi:hypothetical protein
MARESRLAPGRNNGRTSRDVAQSGESACLGDRRARVRIPPSRPVRSRGSLLAAGQLPALAERHGVFQRASSHHSRGDHEPEPSFFDPRGEPAGNGASLTKRFSAGSIPAPRTLSSGERSGRWVPAPSRERMAPMVWGSSPPFSAESEGSPLGDRSGGGPRARPLPASAERLLVQLQRSPPLDFGDRRLTRPRTSARGSSACRGRIRRPRRRRGCSGANRSPASPAGNGGRSGPGSA